MIWLGYAICWLAVGAAVTAAVIVTHKASVIWFFLIPLMINLRYKKTGDDGSNEEK